MRSRQIHLDFHTSGLIDGIGSRFDAEAFARAFKEAHVNSVTLFSKCHHGLSYHPTEVGQMHPGLDFDLLRAQIDALHAVGIKAPIYLSAAWDEHAAKIHPEWLTVGLDDRHHRAPANPTGWLFLDFASDYIDYLGRQVEEVMRRYPDGDGIFIDICFNPPSVSEPAKAAMTAAGLDWTDPADVERHAAMLVPRLYEAVNRAVHKYDPDMPIFFNSGHIRRGDRKRVADYFTHLELESLPTAGWGYDHFPLSARYVDPLGIPFLGMTGKFHFTWGEIGGYKRGEALRYECGAMLAHGALCSVGDHLHPTGRIDPSTMQIVGEAYAHVEACEPWVHGTRNRAEIALLSREAVTGTNLSGAPDRFQTADDGASRVLLEGGFMFDVVDTESDFTAYDLLILPDTVPVDAALKAKVEAFAGAGGRVLLTGASGIDPQTGPVFDIGATWEGTSPMAGGDYLNPVAALQADGIGEPHFMYLPSERLRVTDGTSLADIHDPYMDRTRQHFSGHIHAPCRLEPTGYAGIVEKGNFMQVAHPIFSAYHKTGAVRMLEIAEKVIAHALGHGRMVETSLPRAGRVTLRAQVGERRDVMHLLYATPALRGNLLGNEIQPIQDITPLSDIRIRLRPRGPVAAVRAVPGGEDLPFEAGEDCVSFTLPRLDGHGMVEIAYDA